MPPNHRLTRDERLRRPADFRRVYEHRCSTADGWLVVYACENGLMYSRIGLSVGKRWGKAHVRNRVRRLYREAFRLAKKQMPAGLDLVLVPRRVEGLTLSALLESLPVLAEKAKKKLERRPVKHESKESDAASP